MTSNNKIWRNGKIILDVYYKSAYNQSTRIHDYMHPHVQEEKTIQRTLWHSNRHKYDLNGKKKNIYIYIKKKKNKKKYKKKINKNKQTNKQTDRQHFRKHVRAITIVDINCDP